MTGSWSRTGATICERTPTASWRRSWSTGSWATRRLQTEPPQSASCSISWTTTSFTMVTMGRQKDRRIQVSLVRNDVAGENCSKLMFATHYQCATRGRCLKTPSCFTAFARMTARSPSTKRWKCSCEDNGCMNSKSHLMLFYRCHIMQKSLFQWFLTILVCMLSVTWEKPASSFACCTGHKVCVLKHAALHWFSLLRGPKSLSLCRFGQFSQFKMLWQVCRHLSQHFDFKILLFTQKVLHNQAPPYLDDLLHLQSPLSTASLLPMPVKISTGSTVFLYCYLHPLKLTTNFNPWLHWPAIINITTQNTYLTAFMFNHSFSIKF